MSKTKRANQWPPIYRAPQRSGQVCYQVDLGLVDGKRKRLTFPTKEQAVTYAEQARIARANQGMAAFTLPMDVRLDATKAHAILAAHGVSIFEAAKHYQKHVLAYKAAPVIREIVQRYIADSISRNLRSRTIGDLKHRLNCFAADFGESRLSDITLDELKEWVQDDGWDMRTRINFLTKLSQLYGYAIRHEWADSNLTERIDRPAVDETTPEVFAVPQAQQLLTHAQEFDLLPYMAIGLFAGVRSAEMARLDGRDINFASNSIRIGADVAKKRSQRIVDMQPALLAWLEPCREKLQAGGKIVDHAKFRKNKESLLEVSGIRDWPANGLRHSFGSYHLAMFESADKTSHQMGNSVEMVHKHYKALVPKAEAERFWNLRPEVKPPSPDPAPAGQAIVVPAKTEQASLPQL